MVVPKALILHVDVDAFFASVEQLLIPSLRSRPVIVGSGVIASCSYEARRFGLRAGMELHRARRLCPAAVILDGNYPIYRCFAEQIWRICREYTCGLETFLDEAYGEVADPGTFAVRPRDGSNVARIYRDPLTLGRHLQRRIGSEVGLPVSIGLAGNRMLAKIASAAGKPGGVVWIRHAEAENLLTPLPVEKLPGVGHKTAEQLHEMNVNTVGDLQALPRESLRTMFGRRGEVLFERCRGRDTQLVRPDAAPRTISRETTFHEPTCDGGEIRGMLFYLLERAMRTLRRKRLLTRGVELDICYDDWKRRAARRTLPEATWSDGKVFAVMLELLERLHTRRVALRHVGIVLSHFRPAAAAARLFAGRRQTRGRALHDAIDRIRDRWGHASVVSGTSIELLGRLEQNDYGFVLRTPSLTK
jgi:DNA polymerase-4